MVFIFPIISYLIGSIPFGYILVKGVKGIDIREHGSKNIGATNIWRVAGKPFGIAAFVFDLLKGFIPVLAAYKMYGDPVQTAGANMMPGKSSLAMICGIAAILGHIFPLFLRFRGGKAAATTCGVFLFLSPHALAIAVAVWALTVFISRFVSLGTILASISLVVAVILADKDPLGKNVCLTIFAVVISIAIIILHRSNIKRIINGTENRIKNR